jgi:hypothetical protein
MENGETQPEEFLPKTAEEAQIVLRDGRPVSGYMSDGTIEKVHVRIVSQAAMSDYAQATITGDEEDELKCYIPDKPKEWLDRMSPWFRTAVFKEGQLLNFPLLEPYLDRRLKRMKILGKVSPEFQLLAKQLESTLKEQFTSSSPPRATGKPTSGPTARAS